MSLPVFIHLTLGEHEAGQVLSLSGPEARHAVTVKRVEVGEKIALVDGAGLRGELTVTAVEGKEVLQGRLESLEIIDPPRPRVVIVQAIPKSDRAELAVDLATQAGADEIVAWQSHRCIAKWDAKKALKAIGKWEAAAQSAAKQSRRAVIPSIRGPRSTVEIAQELKTAHADGAEIYVLHEEATESIKTAPLTSEVVYLLIGPEGGIGEEELAQLTDSGAVPIKLGPQVLRTASAGMVALSAIGVRTSRW